MDSNGGNPKENNEQRRNDRDSRDIELRKAQLRRARKNQHFRDRFDGSKQSSFSFSGLASRVIILFVGLILFSVVGIGGLGLTAYTYLLQDLPSMDALFDRQVFQSVDIYDRNGVLLASLWDKENGGRRTWTNLADISPWVIKATLAAEDSRFYENPGIDPARALKAFFENSTEGEITSGASTITQQLARNVLMDADERTKQSYVRKAREMILAVQMTNSMSKDAILEGYLNTSYYGNISYSIGTAAEGYFNKPAKDLTLAESALLAGLPQSPSRFDPFTNPTLAKERQEWVIDSMVQHGYITQEEADAAKAEQIKLVRKQYDFLAPHFVNYVSGLLWEKYGTDMYTLGLKVYTTLDLNLEQKGEEIVKQHVSTIRNLDASNGALVAIDPKTGEILSMVGSADYYDDSIDGQVNMTVAERQPGSTLKPFTYLTAFMKKGLNPATVMVDRQIQFDVGYGNVYAPGNHDGTFHGPVSMRRALASSLNVPAVTVMDYVGLDEVLNTLHRFGITTLNDRERYGLAITLGGGEVKLLDLTYAYSVLANGGTQVGEEVPLDQRRLGYSDLQPTAFTKIEDSRGNVLYEYVPKTRQLISPQYAYLITSIISDNEAQEPTYGPNNELLMPRPAAAKTGTTEWYQDSWTMGFTPDIVAGSWVGNADNHAMQRVVGASGAGKIWNSFIQEASQDKPYKEFIVPEGVERAEVWSSDPLTAKWRLRWDWFLSAQIPSLQANGAKSGFFLNVTTGRNQQNMPTVDFNLINVAQYFKEGGTYWTTEDAAKEPTPDPNKPPFVAHWEQITNTAGIGAYLRYSQNLEDKMVLLPEGTKLEVISEDKEVRKTTWRHVRDEQGREGWIPAYFLSVVQ